MTTSGSTGDPKVIKIDRSQIEASVFMTKNALELKPNMNALICLDPKYIASIIMAARCIILDMNMIIVEPSSNPLKSIDPSLHIDFASFVPIQIDRMVEDGATSRMESIDKILIGGAPLNDRLKKSLKHLNTDIFLTYGMTETVSHVALMKMGHQHMDAHYTLLEGIKMKKQDNGCLAIAGAVTNQKLINTNDLVEIINDSQFSWLGRLDNIINTGGIKIIPETIEFRLKDWINNPMTNSEFIISSIPDSRLGQKIVLITEGEPIGDDEFSVIQAYIKNEFSPFHIPRNAYAVQHFIRTDSGKIVRNATQKLLAKVL